MTDQDEREHDEIDDDISEPEHGDLSQSETNGHVHFPDSPPPAPAPKRTRQRRMVRTVSNESPRPSGGKGTGRTAMEVWPELLAELKAKGKSPYDISVRVVCDDPPPSRPIGNAFSANALLGDRSTSPGDRLYQLIRDNYHLTWAKGPCVYDVQFIWRDSGEYARRGFLQLPDPEEIIAMRQNERRMGVYAGAQAVEPPRYAPPAWEPPPTPQAPPQYPQQQYAAPPSYQQPRWEEDQPWSRNGGRESIEAEQLRAELQRERENTARLQGQMTELVQALREGRMPMPSGTPAPIPAVAPPVPPPVPAPQPQQPIDLDGVVMRVLDRMGMIRPGVGAAPPQPVPAVPPAPPPVVQMSDIEAVVMRALGAVGIKAGVTPGVGVGAPPTPKTMAQEMDAAAETFDRMVSTMQRVRGVGKKLDKIFTGEEMIPEANAELVDDIPKDEGVGKLPFDAVEIPQVKWSDGRPVMFAASRENGKFDPMGWALSNPAFLEKIGEGMSKIGGALGHVVQAAVKAQQYPNAPAEVVDEIPSDAQDAGSWSGMG
jgi:hypothetical protein